VRARIPIFGFREHSRERLIHSINPLLQLDNRAINRHDNQHSDSAFESLLTRWCALLPCPALPPLPPPLPPSRCVARGRLPSMEVFKPGSATRRPAFLPEERKRDTPAYVSHGSINRGRGTRKARHRRRKRSFSPAAEIANIFTASPDRPATDAM